MADSTLLAEMGYFLDKRDPRTISKLGEAHPILYKLFLLLGEENLSLFRENEVLGDMDIFFTLNEEERKKTIDFVHREREDVNSLLKEGQDEIIAHSKFLLHAKLKTFYEGKVDGYGLRDILETSLRMILSAGENAGETLKWPKAHILAAVHSYKTSLVKLEAPKHKRILVSFIEDNLSPLECRFLLQEMRDREGSQ